MEKEINIDLSGKPTRTLLTKLLQQLLVYLMHERAQIPFSFDVFEKFLNKNSEQQLKCYKTQKQVNTAKETYDKICSLKQVCILFLNIAQ
jgi:hypothetical protein